MEDNKFSAPLLSTFSSPAADAEAEANQNMPYGLLAANIPAKLIEACRSCRFDSVTLTSMQSLYMHKNTGRLKIANNEFGKLNKVSIGN